MKHTLVRSSVIYSVGYDRAASTLEIEFVTGLIYQYRKVPRAKFKALLEAESKGRYFNAHIRDHYSYVSV